MMLPKALILLALACVLLAASVAMAVKVRTVWSSLQVFGAACLVIVVLTHVAEAKQWWPSMGWGRPHSVGHYLDLTSTILALTFPVGLIAQALTARRR
jgi:formate hydrogenlyase subunit 3/multisubunit Na+/H+ antiporter MnhD subunit